MRTSSRAKEIDKLGEFVKTYRAKGLAWMKLAADGSMTSSFAKFLSEDEIAAIKERAGAKENDLLFVVADANWQTAAVALGALRCELAKRLGLAKKDDFKLLWVTEFPQFEYSEGGGPPRCHAPSVHRTDGRGYSAAGHRPGKGARQGV